jgi:hypothetical protein
MKSYLSMIAVLGTCFVIGRVSPLSSAAADATYDSLARDVLILTTPEILETGPTRTPAGDPSLSEEDCERAWEGWWRAEGMLSQARAGIMGCGSIKCMQDFWDVIQKLQALRDGLKRIYEEANCEAYRQ